MKEKPAVDHILERLRRETIIVNNDESTFGLYEIGFTKTMEEIASLGEESFSRFRQMITLDLDAKTIALSLKVLERRGAITKVDNAIKLKGYLRLIDSDRRFTEGGKVYNPFSTNSTMDAMIGLGDDAIGPLENKLWDSAHDSALQEVILFTLAHIANARVDQILLTALQSSNLRARAIYLIGARGGPVLPERSIDSNQALPAIMAYFEDRQRYTDLLYRDVSIPIRNYAVAAVIRIANLQDRTNCGPAERFKWIAWELPQYSEQEITCLVRIATTFSQSVNLHKRQNR